MTKAINPMLEKGLSRDEIVARALAPLLQGGRSFDAMRVDKPMLRAWVRSGECLDINDATQDDALFAAETAAAAARLADEAKLRNCASSQVGSAEGSAFDRLAWAIGQKIIELSRRPETGEYLVTGDDVREIARAAVQALLELDEAMVKAGRNMPCDEQVSGGVIYSTASEATAIYRAMLQSILDEQP